MPTRDETITIPVGDEHIAGTLVTPGTMMAGVLFVHGWGGSQQQYIARARELAALGCICLTFDLRGHAQTRSRHETVSREDNLCDVIAAYDALLAEPNVDPGAIAVVGSSYGGYLAAILTALRPVKWLALRAPALYKDSEWDVAKLHLKRRQDLDAYRTKPIKPQQSRALRACAAFAGDVLLVQSENDAVVPPQVVTNYREACTKARSLTYRVLQAADHGLSKEPVQLAYTTLLVGWLREMVFGARAGGEDREAGNPALPELRVSAGS